MLKFLRKNARSWLMIVVMGIIIVVFIAYFGTKTSSYHTEPVAVVDKKIITRADFTKEYENLQEMYKLRYGAKFNAEMLKKINLKQQAYDALINKAVISAKADDLKIKVSDKEIQNMIMSIPAFQVEGRFDERQYQRMLRSNRLAPEEFEEMQRAQMNAAKIEELIRDGIKISEKEIFDVYALQNQKMNLNFVQLSAKDVKKKITPAQSDLENFLKEKSSLFRIPEQVKIKYLAFPAESYYSAINVAEEDILENYRRNKDKYKTKSGKQTPLAEVRNNIVREIKKSRGMQEAFAAAKKAHDLIYQEDNFEAYAANNKLKIYETEFFPLTKPPQEMESIKELASTLMELQKNEMSRVLTAGNGCFLVRVADKKASYTPRLQDITAAVTKKYIESEMQKMAAAEAKSIIERLKKGEKLEKIAREKGLTIGQTGLFAPAANIPKLGTLENATDILYSLSEQKPYPETPLVINNAFVILQFKEISKIDMADFEKQKDLYKQVFLGIKKEEVMKTWLEGNKTALIKEKRMTIEKEAKDL